MEINDFIAKLEAEFQDIGTVSLTPKTLLRDIEGWNSMHILLLVAMIDVNYGVLLSGEDLKKVASVQELFDFVQSKKLD